MNPTWPIRIIAKTYSVTGKDIKLSAIVEGAGDPKAAMVRYVRSRKRAWDWLGVEIIGITPLGQKISIVYEG